MMKQAIAAIFAESIAAKQQFLHEYSEVLERAVEEVVRTIKGGGKVLLFGNGGARQMLSISRLN